MIIMIIIEIIEIIIIILFIIIINKTTMSIASLLNHGENGVLGEKTKRFGGDPELMLDCVGFRDDTAPRSGKAGIPVIFHR